MGYPTAVEPVAGLALLVGRDRRQRRRVDLRVPPAGNEGRHAADRVSAAAVAGAHQQLRVGAHEGDGHRDLAAVRQHEVLPERELLDRAEDVVPAAGVQPRRVVPQLVEDLLHLERGEDRLDQHRGADAAPRHPERILGGDEDVVPEPRLVPVLQLRQVEVRTAAAAECRLRVVEEVEGEVEDAGRDGLAVDHGVLLDQVPAARTHQQGRDLVLEAVLLAVAGVRELQLLAHRVVQVLLTLDHVAPARTERVLDVGHEHLGAGVQRVDHHLAVDGARDLGPAAVEVRGRGSHRPVRVADFLRLSREGRILASLDAGVAIHPVLEQLHPALLELPAKVARKLERLRSQDVFRRLEVAWAGDLDSAHAAVSQNRPRPASRSSSFCNLPPPGLVDLSGEAAAAYRMPAKAPGHPANVRQCRGADALKRCPATGGFNDRPPSSAARHLVRHPPGRHRAGGAGSGPDRRADQAAPLPRPLRRPDRVHLRGGHLARFGGRGHGDAPHLPSRPGAVRQVLAGRFADRLHRAIRRRRAGLRRGRGGRRAPAVDLLPGRRAPCAALGLRLPGLRLVSRRQVRPVPVVAGRMGPG